jgi:5-formyltetrahydrofolate cyclo-ligase
MLAPVGGQVSADAVIAAKRALRARLLAARSAMPARERKAAGEALASKVLSLPEVVAARVVALYAGTGTEPPTLPLVTALAARGVTVLLPVLLPGDELAWGAYDGTLVPGRHGLLEPSRAGRSLSEAAVVVVPGVAYDASGRRLGRGGGSYDRCLVSVTVPVAGLAFDGEVVEEVPVEPHDARVDVVVTPTRVLRVR